MITTRHAPLGQPESFSLLSQETQPGLEVVVCRQEPTNKTMIPARPALMASNVSFCHFIVYQYLVTNALPLPSDLVSKICITLQHIR